MPFRGFPFISTVIFFTTATSALAGPPQYEDMSDKALKAAYLSCELRAQLDSRERAGMQDCSAAYEALKARVFDGDWQKLRNWAELQLRPRINI